MSPGWQTFWHVVIWTALGTYFSLAVIIAVGGYFDVKKMFRRLNEAHAQASRESASASDRT